MTQKAKHPSEYIDKQVADIIRSAATGAEHLKDLHPDQLKCVYDAQWFRMFLPAEFGGPGWSLPRILQLEEGLSWADGSTGWVVTLCAGAGWFAGFLPPALLPDITSNDQFCMAGSGAATGVADGKGDGYEVSGTWKYASGALHANWFTANCVVRKDGIPRRDEDGSPLVRPFLFHRDEVALQKRWNPMGMIATASHTFEVKSLSVPGWRCFSIDHKDAILSDALYQYPFLQLAETTLSVNLSGMATRFLDLCDPLFAEKMKHASGTEDHAHLQLLATARSEMALYRARFYEAVNATWELCVSGENLAKPALDRVSNASYTLAGKSLRLVDALYPYCGLAAADTTTELNRVWRNLHTASQHALFRPAWK